MRLLKRIEQAFRWEHSIGPWKAAGPYIDGGWGVIGTDHANALHDREDYCRTTTKELAGQIAAKWNREFKMRTLDQIAGEQYIEYTVRDIETMKMVRNETVLDLRSRLLALQCDPKRVEQAITEFKQDNKW